VNEATEDLGSSQTHRIGIAYQIRQSSQTSRRQRNQRSLLTLNTVGMVSLLVHEILGPDLIEVAPTENEEPVQALSAHGAHEVLGKGVRPRGSNRSFDDPDAFSAEHFVEHDHLDGQLLLPAQGAPNQLEQTNEGHAEEAERHSPSSP